MSSFNLGYLLTGIGFETVALGLIGFLIYYYYTDTLYTLSRSARYIMSITAPILLLALGPLFIALAFNKTNKDDEDN